MGRILLEGRPVEYAPAGATVQLEIPGRVFPGDRVFKTHDARLMERARSSYKSPDGQRKNTPLSLQSRAVWASR